jgi:hypothetical protein
VVVGGVGVVNKDRSTCAELAVVKLGAGGGRRWPQWTGFGEDHGMRAVLKEVVEPGFLGQGWHHREGGLAVGNSLEKKLPTAATLGLKIAVAGAR